MQPASEPRRNLQVRRFARFALVPVVVAGALALAGVSSAQEHAAPHGAAPHGAAGEHAVEPHHGGAEHAAHAEHGPKPINWADFSNKETPPYLALLINFGVLAFGYYALGKKPIAAALKQRKEDIGKEIEDARRLLEDAQERSKKHTKDLKNVAADVKIAREALIEAGEGERDRLIREAEEKAARVGRDAGFLVEQEAKQLHLDITREAVDASVARAEALLRAAVTQADHERLAEEFLAELSSKPVGGAS